MNHTAIGFLLIGLTGLFMLTHSLISAILTVKKRDLRPTEIEILSLVIFSALAVTIGGFYMALEELGLIGG